MAFVVSEGALQGLSRPQLPAAATANLSTPVAFSNDFAVDYLEIWRKHRAVRTTVSFLARNIAQLGIHAFRRIDDTDRQRLSPADHPLAKVMRQPNAVTTRYRLMDATVHDLAIFDRAYWLKLGSSSAPQVVRIPPMMVTPKGDNWITPEAFEVRGSKGTQLFARDRVLYFRGYGGDTDFGASPMEALRQVLAEDHAGSKARAEILNNGARVSGYLERPAGAPRWESDARERFAKSWRAQYTGGGPMAGGTPILEDGMTFKDATQTARDLQYIEARKLTREEVAAVFFVPPPMVGILDKATFSNITEQHKMLYQDTLGPWLTMIAEEIALQLIPDIAPTESDDLYVEFNLREKLTGNFEERQSAITQAVGGPTMTINEARALDNRPPLEGGDELIRPLNVTQNGDQEPIPADDEQAPASLTPVADTEDDEDDQEDDVA
ncbi:portal protein [Gordonia phage Gudmit]|nr:portal protein [Gordonia phage Gudmit]